MRREEGIDKMRWWYGGKNEYILKSTNEDPTNNTTPVTSKVDEKERASRIYCIGCKIATEMETGRNRGSRAHHENGPSA